MEQADVPQLLKCAVDKHLTKQLTRNNQCGIYMTSATYYWKHVLLAGKNMSHTLYLIVM